MRASRLPSPRTIASVWAAKAAAVGSRSLRRGGGTAIAGLAGLALQPGMVKELAHQLGHGSVLITGTNGKTTTSRLLAEMARRAGLEPLANSSGSNLMRGIASTLALAANAGGALSNPGNRIGVFEVDEATVTLAFPELKPRVAVFTNLFRDQLDRYGEVEAVAERWREALLHAPASAQLVLNADDPAVASLGAGRDGVTYFGVDDKKLDQGCIEHASDARSCLCGAEYIYDIAYFAHVGLWRCPSCGRSRPAAQVSASNLDLRDGRSLRFELSPAGRTIDMGLGGLYNAYDALAAAAAAKALGLSDAAIEEGLASTGAAFGRQEAFEVDGKRVEVFLGKNPAGLNQVLSTLLLDPARKMLLIVLNDGIADGRDISWVWDADFEVGAGRFDSVFVSGSRAEEMALRLKYAEWDESKLYVDSDMESALSKALAATASGDCLTVVPTYTAMLKVRDLLASRSGRAPFWRQ